MEISLNVNDKDILFEFSTYEEFTKERLKLNHESTLKLKEMGNFIILNVMDYSRSNLHINHYKSKLRIERFLRPYPDNSKVEYAK